MDIPVRIVVDAINNAGNSLKGVSDQLKSFGDTAKTAGAGMAALGGITVLVTKSLIEQSGAYEQNTIAFETMLGSVEKAKTLLNDIKEFAKATPFNLEELVDGSKKLLAYNVSAEDIIPTLDSLGNIAAGVGREKLPQLILAFGQVKAATKLTGAELRQFSEAGVPLLQTLADQAGVTAAVMVEKIADGAVSFDMVNKAMQSMSGEGGKFNNLMQKQAESTLGKWSNLQDAFQQTQVLIGQALLPAANKLLDAIIPLVNKFADWAKENTGLIKGLIIAGLAIGGIGAVLVTIGLVIPPIIAAVSLLGSIFGFLGSILGGIGSVIGVVVGVLGGPLTIAIGLILAAITFFTLAWKNNWFDIQGKVQVAGKFIQTAIQGIITFFQNLWNFMLSLPTVFTNFVEQLRSSIYIFFTETLPFAIGFLAGRLVKFVTEEIPAFIASAIQWFGTLPGKIGDFLSSLPGVISNWFTKTKDNAVILATNMATAVVQWFSNMKDGISNWLSQLPGTVSTWFSQAKDNAINFAKDMFNGVKEWFQKIIDFFGNIISKAGEAINKTKEAATTGYNVGARAYGGPVNSSNTVLVGENGPEMFTPQTAGNITPNYQLDNKGSGGVSIVVNLGTLINTQTEVKNFAMVLWEEIGKVAKSQNKTPQELLGVGY